MSARRIVSRFCLVGLLAAVALAALAGCAGDSATTSLAPATAAPAAAPVAAPAAPPTKPTRLTATQINEKCWMSAEVNKVADLDKRMKLVDKCVAEKTKEQQGM